jgi:lysophospholipase L1-like esterase
MSEARSRKHRLGRELLVGVVATAAVLLALEIGARVYVWARALVISDEFEVAHPDGSWSPRPGFRKAGIEVNALGFRGPDIDLVKPAGTFRLVALGDSTTFGDRSQRDGPYAVRLQVRLDLRHDCRARIQVVNAGVEGYQARHVRHHLEHAVRPLSPDLLLLFVGWNDLWSDNPQNPTKRLDRWSPFNRLLRTSYAMKALTKLAFDLRRPVREVNAETREAYQSFTPSRLLQDYEDILDIGQAMGARMVMLTLPSPLGSRTDTGHRFHFPHYTASQELVTLLWHKYNAAVRDLAARRGIPLVDLARDVAQVPQSETFFSDTAHLTPEGAGVVAAILESQLLSAGLLPCAGRPTRWDAAVPRG